MYTVLFNESKHFDILAQWLVERGLPVPEKQEMPELGYVASISCVEVAMGFLRRVEGGFAQLDGLVTNPEAPGEYRDRGIDSVVSALLIESKRLNIRTVMAYSSDANTLTRAAKHGFVQLPQTLIAIDTSKGAF